VRAITNYLLIVGQACRLPVRQNGDQEWSPYNCLAPIFQSVRARFFGAMDATVNLAARFNAVTDYLAITVGTGRCQHVNRAFEAVKGPSLSGRDNLE
jgi:hypothetical protein